MPNPRGVNQYSKSGAAKKTAQVKAFKAEGKASAAHDKTVRKEKRAAKQIASDRSADKVAADRDEALRAQIAAADKKRKAKRK